MEGGKVSDVYERTKASDCRANRNRTIPGQHPGDMVEVETVHPSVGRPDFEGLLGSIGPKVSEASLGYRPFSSPNANDRGGVLHMAYEW